MYYYIINYWDEIDCELYTDSGIVAATSYGEAAQRATEYYGTQNTVDIQLSELEQVLSEEELLEMFKHEGE